MKLNNVEIIFKSHTPQGMADEFSPGHATSVPEEENLNFFSV